MFPMKGKSTDTTVKLIKDAIKEFNYKAGQLNKIAIELDKTGDWSLAGEALSIISNNANLRLDLFAIRPIRELERQIRKNGENHE